MAEEELPDYNEDEETTELKATEKKTKKGHYVNMHTSSFKDFILKSEILQAVVDCGFEHPSEGQF
jgi:ATP-dependent RNA helicase UAP56/SUB2